MGYTTECGQRMTRANARQKEEIARLERELAEAKAENERLSRAVAKALAFCAVAKSPDTEKLKGVIVDAIGAGKEGSGA